jgi:hypothetical protein
VGANNRHRVHHNRYKLAARPRPVGVSEGWRSLTELPESQYTYRGEDVRPDPMLAGARVRGVIHARQLQAFRAARRLDG